MDYNDKLRLAKEALDSGSYDKDTIEHIFPELVESEDERIRKDIIYHIQHCDDTIDEVSEKRMIVWLEKQGEKKSIDNLTPQEAMDIAVTKCFEQGEQKPTDKVEPKFEVGDWCIDNTDGTVFQIVKVLNKTYTYKTNDGKEYSCTHYSLENDARLWTIQDAKDGDVLSYRDGQWIFIYKEIIDDSYFYYTLYSTIDQDLTIDDAAFTLLGDAITPATKEQRDLLFQKMKEIGYEWDAEKKESKKIEQKPTGWSEEDKKRIDIIIDYLKPMSIYKECYTKGFRNKAINWLKSIKDRYA